jgi:hypothetical protein
LHIWNQRWGLLLISDRITVEAQHPALFIVAYLLKVRTVKPEKQQLLADSSVTTFVSRQQLSKHVLVAMDKHATIKVLLGAVFSTQSMQRGYKKVY